MEITRRDFLAAAGAASVLTTASRPSAADDYPGPISAQAR